MALSMSGKGMPKDHEVPFAETLETKVVS